MKVTISKADAKAALCQHLQALALSGWEQLRLFPSGTTKSALTKTVRTWSTQMSMAELLRKQNGSRRARLDHLRKLVEQVGRSKADLDPYVFGDFDRDQKCQEIRSIARELLKDFGWPQKRPPKRDSFLPGVSASRAGRPAPPAPPRWHRLKQQNSQATPGDPLNYHQAVFDLLCLRPEVAKRSLNRISTCEKKCGLIFPASVVELYSLRYIDDIFLDHTNQDSLLEVGDLIRRLEEKDGVKYLTVAIENQGVATWHVPLGRRDDPPVLEAPDGNFLEAQVVWQAFSNFVFDMIANNFGGWRSGLRLSGKATLPDQALLSRLRRKFNEGPRTRHRASTVHRFFLRGGVLRVICNTPRDRATGRGDWIIEADSPEVLFELAREVWHYADVSKKIKATSDVESRSKGRDVLRQLRKL